MSGIGLVFPLPFIVLGAAMILQAIQFNADWILAGLGVLVVAGSVGSFVLIVTKKIRF